MIYVIFGSDSYLIKKERDQIIDESIQEKDMNVSYFDVLKTPFEVMIADAQTIPFFSDKKSVVLQNANFLSGSASVDAKSLSVLEQYIEQENTSTILILECNQEKLDQRKTIVKKLKKCSKMIACNALEEKDVERFIAQEIAKRNLVFSKEALRLFSLRVKKSVGDIINELEKLQTYSSSIEVGDVQVLIKRNVEDNVFDLFDAIMKKDMNRSFSLWKDFDSQNIEVIALLSLLASQFRFLSQVKTLYEASYTKQSIASELNAHPYRVEKTMSLAKSIRMDDVQQILYELSVLDQSIKKGEIDKKLGFELFILKRGNL